MIVGGTAVAVGTAFTNSRTVWYLIGDGWLRRIVMVLGKLRLGILLGFLDACLTAAVLIAWLNEPSHPPYC